MQRNFPMIESSLRSLYATYVSTDKQIARNRFPKTLKLLAEGIESKRPQHAPVFTHQLLKRKDSMGHCVDWPNRAAMSRERVGPPCSSGRQVRFGPLWMM
jgi:hypothetical protein